MKTFRDSTGREWIVAITLGAIRRVFDRLGVDMLNPDQGDPPLLTRLHTSPILLVDVLFVLIDPAVILGRGLTAEEFGTSLDGQAAYAAYTAMMEDWTDFFRQLRRPDLAEGLTAHRELVASHAQKTAESLTPARAAIERQVDRRRAAILAEIESGGAGESSGSSPESPAATPGP